MRDELHTILDAVLDYIDRTGRYVHLSVTDTALDVIATAGDGYAGVGYEALGDITAETTRGIINNLEKLEADTNRKG